MAKLKVKGTVLKQGSGTTFTPVAQVTGFSITGMETETYDADTLDGSVGIAYDPTGRVEGGSSSWDLLYDPALSGHQDITDIVVAAALLTTGLPNKVNWKVLFANTSSTELTFTSAGVGFEITGAISDGLRGTATFKHDGCPGLPS